MKKLSHRPLHPAIGAEVLDLDLSVPLDSDTQKQILNLWAENSVLIFRNQDLSPEQQLMVTSYFGDPRPTVNLDDKPELQFAGMDIPGIVVLSNVKVDGKPIGAPTDGELWFHSDNCYLPESALASLLYAIEPVAVGGETCWASGYAAYEGLSPEIKQKLDGVMAEYVLDYKADRGLRNRLEKAGPDAFRAIHPAVVKHPQTGRPSLFVNRQTTETLIGMDPQESDELLLQLFDYQEEPRFVYEHKWQPGDLAIWDNRSCLHSRKDFDPSQRRTMRRSTAGTVKLEAAKLQATAA